MKTAPLFYVCLSIVCFGIGCSKKETPKPTPESPDAAKTKPVKAPDKADEPTKTPEPQKETDKGAAANDADEKPEGASEDKPSDQPTNDADEKADKASDDATKDDADKAPDSDAKKDDTKKTASTSGGDPSKTVKAYLQAGIKQDKKRIKQLVQAKCYSKRDIMNVSALDMMGMRMRVKSVAASTSQRKGDRAKVKAHISGSVKGSSSGTKSLFGKKVKFNIKNVKASSVKVSRTFDLVRLDGRWLISC